MKQAKKVGAMAVAGAKAAEETLARDAARGMEEKLPEGHPLRQAAEGRREGGDLDGLPPGHPMRVAMEQAADRYFEQEEQDALAAESDKAQGQAREVRKANKLDRANARRAEADRQADVRRECQTAAKAINGAIEDSLGTMREIYRVVSENEEILGQSQYCKMRAAKLLRLMQAVERGMFDCRMKV